MTSPEGHTRDTQEVEPLFINAICRIQFSSEPYTSLHKLFQELLLAYRFSLYHLALLIFDLHLAFAAPSPPLSIVRLTAINA